MQTLAEFLKNYIEQKGISYSKVAKMCGIDRTLLGRYAKGERVPSGKEVLDKIAYGLEMSETDKDIMYSLFECVKNNKKSGAIDGFIKMLSANELKYNSVRHNWGIYRIDKIQSDICSLTDWKDILSYALYVVDGAERIYIRLDYDYVNIYRTNEYINKVSDADITWIVRLCECNEEGNVENVKCLESIYPVLCEVKSCEVYCYNKRITESKDSEINFILTNKGVVLFDKTFKSGLFLADTEYLDYYKRVFNVLKGKCELFVRTSIDDIDLACDRRSGDNIFDILQDVNDNLVNIRRKDKNTVCISDGILINIFNEYINV